MPEKVTFDGPNKRVVVNSGITSLDVDEDIYSAWKRWVQADPENLKYDQAFYSIGGQTLPGGKYAGQVIFLLNSWKIRPDEVDHTLTLDGNLYTDDSSEPIVPTTGAYTVLVRMETSAQAQGVSTSGSTAPTASENADAIWSRVSEDTLTMEQVMRLLLAAQAGDMSKAGTTITIKDTTGAVDRLVATVDNAGARTVTTRDTSAT